jgi:hypothetical protein
MRFRSRILVSVLALLLCLSSAVFAEAINGTFRDFPIVKVKVNGTLLEPPVPGVNFHGSTLVPVRAIAEALGGTVAWNADTWVASITAPNAAELRGQVDQLKTDKTQLEADNAALRKQINDLRNPPLPPAPPRGMSRANPAKIGDAFTFQMDSWDDNARLEIELRQVVSGDAAWVMVQQANMFNRSPSSTQQYVLAKFRVKVISVKDDKPFSMSNTRFEAVSSAGVVYGDLLSVAGLKPSINVDLYSGAQAEGWAYFLVDKTDNPLALFMRRVNGGIWFDLKPQ